MKSFKTSSGFPRHFSHFICGLSALLLSGPPESLARNWRNWPFSATSPWNMPIGSRAAYQEVPGLAQYTFTFNYQGRWTSSIVQSKWSDPIVPIRYTAATGSKSVYTYLKEGGSNCSPAPGDADLLDSFASTGINTAGNYYSTLSTPDSSLWVLPQYYHFSHLQYRSWVALPLGSCPSPDTDGLMSVMLPDGWVLDSYASVILSGNRGLVTTMASFIDGRGDGTGWWNGRRASMLPSFAGLIRKGEIASGKIPHAMALQAPPTALMEKAVWPAYAFDRDSRYTGNLPVGALLAIPPEVNLLNLGLSPQGLVIARAAQDFGIYVVDRGGSDLSLLAEYGNTETNWNGTPAPWQDLGRILATLKRVSNNTQYNLGGGGIPRTSLAPPFTDGIETSPIPPSDTQPPPTPSFSNVRALNCNEVSLSWSQIRDSGNSGLKGFKIYKQGIFLKRIPTNEYTTTVKGLLQGVEIPFQISANDNAGNESALSPAVIASTPRCP